MVARGNEGWNGNKRATDASNAGATGLVAGIKRHVLAVVLSCGLEHPFHMQRVPHFHAPIHRNPSSVHSNMSSCIFYFLVYPASGFQQIS